MREEESPEPNAPATVENPLRTPWYVPDGQNWLDHEYRMFDNMGGFVASGYDEDRLRSACDAVNSHASLLARLEKLEAAARATLYYVDNLNEDTPVDMNCKECVGRVYFDRGTPEPPLCWIHQLQAALDTDANKERDDS